MITIGIDFGSEYTKICVEDATNPQDKTCKFFQFRVNGESSYFLPSKVQINQNGKLSYGSENEEDCLCIDSNFSLGHIPELVRPVRRVLTEPKPTRKPIPKKPLGRPIPPKPIKSPYPEKPAFHLKKWKEKCKKIDLVHESEIRKWKSVCKLLNGENQKNKKNWEIIFQGITAEYYRSLNEYKAKNVQLQKENEKAEKLYRYNRKRFRYLIHNKTTNGLKEFFIFRHFKSALFFRDVKWYHQIDAEKITIWYFTYLLYVIVKEYGKNFQIRMGIPVGRQKNNFDRQREIAICALMSSINLMKKYNDFVQFLSASYLELMENTLKTDKFTDEDLLEYRINVIPEVGAGLVSLFTKKQLLNGYNFLLDIGAFSTKIVFFYANEAKIPVWYLAHSFSKGYNFIIDNIDDFLNETEYGGMRLFQEIMRKPKGIDAIHLYHNELKNEIDMVMGKIKVQFEQRGFSSKGLEALLAKLPLMSMGGGARVLGFDGSIPGFSIIRCYEANSYSSFNHSLLYIAYGLSIHHKHEFNITFEEELIENLVLPDSFDDNKTTDYGLSDT